MTVVQDSSRPESVSESGDKPVGRGVEAQPDSAENELSVVLCSMAAGLVLISGMIVWPECIFAAFGQTTNVVRLRDVSPSSDAQSQKANVRVGFRDDHGEFHPVSPNRLSFSYSSGKASYSGITANELQYVSWCPGLWRPLDPGIGTPDAEASATWTIFILASAIVQLASAGYVAGFLMIRALRRRKATTAV